MKWRTSLPAAFCSLWVWSKRMLTGGRVDHKSTAASRRHLRVFDQDLHLVPLLHLRPDIFEVPSQSTAEKNVIALIQARIGIVSAAGDLNALEVLPISPAVTAENNHNVAGIVPGAPVPVGLVIADGFGQAVLWSEIIDGAGLAVTVGEDRRSGALFRRQAVVNTRHLAHHIFPAELVGKVLRQRSGGLVFSFRRFQ